MIVFTYLPKTDLLGKRLANRIRLKTEEDEHSFYVGDGDAPFQIAINKMRDPTSPFRGLWDDVN